MTIYTNPEMPEEYIANSVNAASSVLYSAAGSAKIIGSANITTDTSWDITSFSFFYTATSTVGNRLPGISVTLPGTLYPLFLWTCPYNVPASTKLSASGGPAGPVVLPTDQSTITTAPANPVASSLTTTLSTNFAHRIQSMRFVYTTSSTAGNRLVEVQLQDAASNIISESFISTQAASLTYVYSFGIGVPANAQNASLHQTGPLPEIDLPPGGKVKIQDATGTDSADRVTSVAIADLTRQSVLASVAVGFAPIPLPAPFRVPKSTPITVYDTLNIDGNDTIELYITGVKGYG